MVSYISGILKSELKQLSQDGFNMSSETYENFSITTQLSKPGQGKYGALPLSRLMIDASVSRRNNTEPLFALNMLPKTKQSALYLIRCQNGCNEGYFKIGKAKRIKGRLPQYKCALPLDNTLMIVAVLIVPDNALIVALEKVLIANLNHWCVEYPTRIKQLRKTEWYRRMKGLGEALALRTMINLGCYASKTTTATLHLYGKTAWNQMLALPNIGYTPAWSVVNPKYKGLSPIEAQLADAEALLIEDPDDAGFTRKELNSEINKTTLDVEVVISPISS